MKFRRLVSFLMVAVMVLSVMAMAGCGDKKPTGGGNGESAASEEEFFLDMPSELRGTKVQFATWIDHNATETANTLRGFERETGMKIEIVAVPQSSYIQKLNSLIAADEAPDVIVDNNEFPNTLRLLAPLSWEENAIDPKDPFWDQAITNTYTLGDKTYLVNAKNSTFNMAGNYVLYNKTALEENGIKTPKQLMEEDNWNLDSFIVLLRQMKQRYMQDKKPAWVSIGAIMDMMGAGQIVLNKETNQFENGLRSPEALAALQWCIKYKEEGLIDLSQGGTGGNMREGGLSLDGCYSLRSKPGWYYDDKWEDYEGVICPKVNATDADYPKTSANRSYGICKAAKNPKGAGYFLRYFLNGDNYDLNEVYKNEWCAQLFLDIRDKYMDYEAADFASGCFKILDPEGTLGHKMKDLIKVSYAQIGTELSKTQNTVDAAVAKGNEVLNEVMNAQ